MPKFILVAAHAPPLHHCPRSLICTALQFRPNSLSPPPSTAATTIQLSGARMTTYGTIPTSSPPAVNLDYVSVARERLHAGLAARRPWRQMFDVRCFELPKSAAEVAARFGANAAYFLTNYAIAALTILLLSLLWHPISLMVFIATMAAWLYLYFMRGAPLVVAGRTIDDRTVLIALSAATIAVLLLTEAAGNIVAALMVAMAVVLIHGAVRITDDLVLDATETGGLLRSTGSQSSSF
ncbi:PRA1 rab family protein [Perilla frutescens var. hirtella]|uniref:PRA1 family protein n=1 Tax=Perilla frutescens var. hirtella TaxID=608512 RepID=A0AAD4IU00_PERFH|nr:PRA1 rab family protein [Perilla frutescens var. hirtella]